MRRFLHTVRTVFKSATTTYTLVKELREPYSGGVVHLALNQTQEKCIIKTVEGRSTLDNEYDILAKYQHKTPHVRQLIEKLDDVGNIHSIALRYLDDDLRAESAKERLSRNEIKQVAQAVLEVLCMLHRDGLVHADIKLDNILINYGCQSRFAAVQIGDFGTVVAQDSKHLKNGAVVGAAYARSPEMLLKQPWGIPTDIWSFGNMILALIFGGDYHLFMPLKADSVQLGKPEYELTVLKRIYRFFGPFPISFFAQVDDESRAIIIDFHRQVVVDKPFGFVGEREVPPADLAFVLKIMKIDPQERPTAEQLLEDEWFSEDSADTRAPLA